MSTSTTTTWGSVGVYFGGGVCGSGCVVAIVVVEVDDDGDIWLLVVVVMVLCDSGALVSGDIFS